MGVSFQELILLLMIGLIVLGPERLPRVANQIGKWLGQARRMTRVMKRQLEDELNLDRQYDLLPPARTRHSAPGSYSPPVPPPADTPNPDAEAQDPQQDDNYSPAHGPDEAGTGVASGDAADDDEPAPPAGTADDGEPATSPGDDKKESA